MANKYELNNTEKEKVSHGMAINVDLPNGKITLIHGNKLIAIAEISERKAKVLKVFI